MARRKQQIEVRRGDVWASGETKMEAKKLLEERVDEALQYHAPKLIHAEGADCAFLIVHTPSGWQSRMIDLGEKVLTLGGCTFGYRSREDAERGVRAHLAQKMMQFDGRTGEEVIVDEEDRKDHLRWVRWQYAFRELRAEGVEFEQCHRLAPERSYSILLPGETREEETPCSL